MLSLEVRKHQINLDKVVETSVKVIPNITTIFLFLSEIETVSNKIHHIVLVFQNADRYKIICQLRR